MNTTSRATAVDLVDDFLESPAVAVMLGYAEMAGPNAVSLACHDLRQGRPAVVDSALLPPEVSREFFDTARLTSVRLRLQRDHAPEVVDERRPEVVEEPEEPTADTVPLEVTP
ncbi:hypothetical protein [Dietzia natronolimnaea]|uniref:hypothetical protein n=1 Tax=Dietzia natronolimnaea TaxID=161920 RepID=UPI0015FB1D3F|nr:hypothetical protein [Dietzia natronolimnaea]MBB1037841.1 hypothetical protein [Dietzia natronolimnaea]